jgi:hypothetical protein
VYGTACLTHTSDAIMGQPTKTIRSSVFFLIFLFDFLVFLIRSSVFLFRFFCTIFYLVFCQFFMSFFVYILYFCSNSNLFIF